MRPLLLFLLLPLPHPPPITRRVPPPHGLPICEPIPDASPSLSLAHVRRVTKSRHVYVAASDYNRKAPAPQQLDSPTPSPTNTPSCVLLSPALDGAAADLDAARPAGPTRTTRPTSSRPPRPVTAGCASASFSSLCSPPCPRMLTRHARARRCKIDQILKAEKERQTAVTSSLIDHLNNLETRYLTLCVPLSPSSLALRPCLTLDAPRPPAPSSTASSTRSRPSPSRPSSRRRPRRASPSLVLSAPCLEPVLTPLDAPPPTASSRRRRASRTRSASRTPTTSRTTSPTCT